MCLSPLKSRGAEEFSCFIANNCFLTTEQAPLRIESYAGLVLQFNIPEGNEIPADLHYTSIKGAFGGKEAGVVYVEYNKVNSIELIPLLNFLPAPAL